MSKTFKLLLLLIINYNSSSQIIDFKFEKIENVFPKLINRICIDSWNNKWIATDEGLFRIDSNLVVHHYDTNNSKLTSNFLNTLYADDKDNIWIGTYNNGLIKKDKYDNFTSIKYIGREKELLIHDIKSIDGKILLATPNGLYTTSIIDSSKLFEALTQVLLAPTLNGDVNSVLTSPIGDYLATNTGVYKISKNHLSNIGKLGQVHSLCYFENFLWAEDVNSEITSIVFFKKKWKSIKSNLIGNSLLNTCLFSDSLNKCMWIASKKLFMYSNENLLPIVDETFFRTKMINCLMTDKNGIVWIGTADNGIFKLTINNRYDRILNKDSIRLNITFEDSKYLLSATAKTELDEIIIQLKKNESIKLKINGHTDFGNGMSKEELIKLSEKRAKAVKQYLIKKGKINRNRITKVEGFGSQFAQKNGNYNMRVEIIITER